MKTKHFFSKLNLKHFLSPALLGGLCLAACQLQTPAARDPEPLGAARVLLPDPPPEFLAKDTAGTAVEITVAGAGMAPLTRSWLLGKFAGQSVVFDSIPAGPRRFFTGRIRSNGIITHEGTETAAVQAGQTTPVRLLLRDVRTGRAEICVQVEGWPAPRCTPIGGDSSLIGCWQVSSARFAVNGVLSVTAGPDSAIMFTFRGRDSGLTSGMARREGRAWLVGPLPLAYAYLRVERFTDAGFAADYLDSSGMRVPGEVSGSRIPCRGTDSTESLVCWDFRSTLGISGDLRLRMDAGPQGWLIGAHGDSSWVSGSKLRDSLYLTFYPARPMQVKRFYHGVLYGSELLKGFFSDSLDAGISMGSGEGRRQPCRR